MRITALLHILVMANLVGLLIPTIYLSRHFQKAKSVETRTSLATLLSKLLKSAYILVLIAVLTGIGRVVESNYPWFDFGTMLWLGVKQVAGLLMALFVVVTWVLLRKTTADVHGAYAFVERDFSRMRGQMHVLAGLAWLMLIVAMLKV